MIATFKGTVDILDNLHSDERAFVKELKERMEKDDIILGTVCEFLKGKIKDAMSEHFADFSSEIKIQACIEHIVIGLMAGDITVKDLEQFLR